MSITRDVLDLVYDERVSQNEKWGTQRHGLPVWQTVLTEEVDEVAQAILQLRSEKQPSRRIAITELLLKELIQVAAVAVAAAEHVLEEAGQDKPFPGERWVR